MKKQFGVSVSSTNKETGHVSKRTLVAFEDKEKATRQCAWLAKRHPDYKFEVEFFLSVDNNTLDNNFPSATAVFTDAYGVEVPMRVV